MSAGAYVAEPFRLHRPEMGSAERRDAVAGLFQRVVLRRVAAARGVSVNLVIATLGLSYVLRGFVRQTGFGYPNPMTANNDVAFATEEATDTEVRTAVADVRCKRTVGVVEVWTAVETAYPRQAIDAHHDQLELIRQAIQARLANARAVLAGRPPP